MCWSPCHHKAPIASAKGSSSIETRRSTWLAKHICSSKVWRKRKRSESGRTSLLCHCFRHAELKSMPFSSVPVLSYHETGTLQTTRLCILALRLVTAGSGRRKGSRRGTITNGRLDGCRTVWCHRLESHLDRHGFSRLLDLLTTKHGQSCA